MLVWLINATWGSNAGHDHTTLQSLPGCDKKFLQPLPRRTGSSKEDISTLTCPRSSLASRTKNTAVSLATNPLINIIDTTTCAKFIFTPPLDKGIFVFSPNSNFDTSKLQQRKQKMADSSQQQTSPARVSWGSLCPGSIRTWSLLPYTLQLSVTLTAGNCFHRL